AILGWAARWGARPADRGRAPAPRPRAVRRPGPDMPNAAGPSRRPGAERTRSCRALFQNPSERLDPGEVRVDVLAQPRDHPLLRHGDVSPAHSGAHFGRFSLG